MRKLLLALTVVVLALGVVVLVRVLAGRGSSAGGASAASTTARGTDDALELESGAASIGNPARDLAGTSTVDSAVAGASESGILRLTFVSDLDDSPVPDLAYLAYRERGVVKDIARGRSDANGRAEVRDLEENVILVQTQRRPPFA